MSYLFSALRCCEWRASIFNGSIVRAHHQQQYAPDSYNQTHEGWSGVVVVG